MFLDTFEFVPFDCIKTLFFNSWLLSFFYALSAFRAVNKARGLLWVVSGVYDLVSDLIWDGESKEGQKKAVLLCAEWCCCRRGMALWALQRCERQGLAAAPGVQNPTQALEPSQPGSPQGRTSPWRLRFLVPSRRCSHLNQHVTARQRPLPGPGELRAPG